MKIHLKTLRAGAEGIFPPGTMLSLVHEKAEILIAGGYAERIGRERARYPESL